jgi:hypothetical protein
LPHLPNYELQQHRDFQSWGTTIRCKKYGTDWPWAGHFFGIKGLQNGYFQTFPHFENLDRLQYFLITSLASL